jgi:hypothetical protein
MMNRRCGLVAAILAGAALAGCATSAPPPVEARTEPVYRTGSNIPVKDGSASRTLSVQPDVVPRAPAMPLPRPGGG